MKITKRRCAIVVGAASLIGAATQASALTGWQTFAYARDQYNPYVGFYAGTQRNPEYIRFTLNDGSYAGPTSVSLSIDCMNDDFTNWGRSIDQDYSLPRTFTWDVPSWVTHCRVYVSAFNSARYGVLSATAQARYE